MRNFLLILLLLTTICPLCGQDNYWNTNVSQYNNNMTVVAAIRYNGIVQNSTDLELAAFCGDELRGNMRIQYNANADVYIAVITIHGDKSVQITFKVYDHSIKEELSYASSTTVTFKSNEIIGTPSSPVFVDFEVITFKGEGEWSLKQNWLNSKMPDADGTDDIVIEGSATIPEGNNVFLKSVRINENGSLSIENGGVLKVKGSITNSGTEALILNDGGQIVQSNDNVAATFMKSIVNPESWSDHPKTGWQFISSPITDAATSDFVSTTGDYDLYKFDGTQELQWINYKYHDDFEKRFIPGTGYIASYESQPTAMFEGNLNSATDYFEFAINNYLKSDWASFNLLGNPFTFNINWNNMLKDGMIDGYATINPNTGAYIYNTEGEIKVGEGFMVYAYAPNATLCYKTESLRKDQPCYVNVTVSNSKGSDNIIVRFGENDNAGFPKLDNINDEIANIYVRDNGKRYAIFNCDEDVEECPLYFDTKEMGSYTMSVNIKGQFDNLYLLDKVTGEKVNLLLENEYSFIANSTDANDRFVLYKADKTENDECFAYINEGRLMIDGVSGDAQINIYDLLGRDLGLQCYDMNVGISIESLPKGIYIIRLVDNKRVKTQKILF